MFMPLVIGVRVFLYPSPLHYKVIPELIHAWGATILLSTNTFLSGYGRAGGPNDFDTVRLIVAGAEPLRSATRRLYLDKFGAHIHEGYGVTEASPAICFNTLAHNREGTVGRLLPGIEARLEPVPGIAHGGRLQVRGPNVMLGYLDSDRPGELLPPPGGWHDTGDIADIDADGYVAIRGRLRRFAKIGGEMVSLAAVEHIASEVWPDAAFAVTTLPDPRKGERLVLLIAQPGATREAFAAKAHAIGVSELTVPGDVIVVQELPLLGSGKVDHAAVAHLVRGMTGIAAAG
jgi:acyl-[acyl-carrier-protein]-phospholipid O-acyltransferase/long-chain-fatty-acid--[acyl-carrier-protein] ligase